jgi:uncharacterized protein YkwD
MMLLGACLVPLAMSGVVSLSAGTDRVETEGTAAERAALRDGSGEAGSGGGGGEDGGGDRFMGGSTNAGPLGSAETTTTTAPTTTTTAPTTTAPPTTTTTAPPTTDPPADPEPTPGLPPPAAEVVQLVNEERAAASCGPQLTAAAQLHAEDMSARDYMDHVNPEGMDPSARAAAQGYDDPVGENIAMGYPDPGAVMEGWMNSEGHRNNILNCDYHVIGVGVDSDGWYWAQVFAF